MKLLPCSTLACLLLCVSACSTTTTRPTSPPGVAPLLQPEKIEDKYPSIEALKADPESNIDDLFRFGHAAEAALRRANRDQIDALILLTPAAAPCSFWRKLGGRCGQ